ncbi:acyl carrier protein [Paenibacillus athensensis]|uniref:Phosphopantetheine-binding protein n=1 Tax=Paenibacillus athensensis TaxID=1967502 RepID=A0A4Y8Q375_9BACL|nr:acyl carrier protein [Paenibacillus athensensis]MCD1258643.1 acyl carrier protein [Paenibacillus athensensis]
MTIHDKISEIVAMVFRIDPENVKKMSGDELLSTIGMDSINCMEIVVNIEEEFSVTFNDEELLLDNLNTLNKLAQIVEQKTSEHTMS